MYNKIRNEMCNEDRKFAAVVMCVTQKHKRGRRGFRCPQKKITTETHTTQRGRGEGEIR